MTKKLIVLTVFLVLCNLYAEPTFSGILQSRTIYQITNSERVDFELPRARFIYKGAVNEDIHYFVQANLGAVIDVKFSYWCERLKTTLAVGRFLPNFTYHMPIHTGKLVFIDYPMLTSITAPWRQVGYQSETRFGGLKFNLGLFNGANEPDNWSDTTDDGKDVLAGVHYAGQAGALGGYLWIVNAIGRETGDIEGSRSGLYAKFAWTQFNLLAEVMSMDWGNSVNGLSYYLQGGMKFFSSKCEAIFRYDYYDQNTDLKNDDMTSYTAGVNYYLSGLNSMIYLDYLINRESPSLDNDALKIQYQILF